MKKYHKIQTVFKRDSNTKFLTVLEGQYSLPEFEYLKNNKWIFTEKVDGTNIRVKRYRNGDIAFGGKTEQALFPSGLLTTLNERFKTPKRISRFKDTFEDTDVCLYGEGYGARVKKGGGNYRLDQDFVLFDVKIGEWWLKRKDVEEIATKLDIDIVPIVGEGTLIDMVANIKRGVQSTWGDFMAEGYVAQPAVALKARNDDRIITKIKYKDFQH